MFKVKTLSGLKSVFSHLVAFMFCLCLSIQAQAQAQAQQTRGVAIKTTDGQTLSQYTNSYALLIGVSDYQSGWPDLESIPGELDNISKALAKLGFQVEQVMNPDEDTLEDAFEDFMDAYGYNPDNRLLFYFAGHGYTRDNNSKGYLVPVDAPNPLQDEIGFLRKAYAMTDLLALARKIESRHALFLFDSCFSGTIFKTRALPKAPPLINRLTSQSVRQFITAGSAGEEVPARSVFAPAFVDAIEYGLGDLNGDGYVTGSELGMFLQEKVANYAPQTPQYGKINDYELARGDFVFALGGGAEPTQVAMVTQKPVAPIIQQPVSLPQSEQSLPEQVPLKPEAETVQVETEPEPKSEPAQVAREPNPKPNNDEPNPIFRIEPAYPAAAARDGKEGYVILSFDVTEQGSVENVSIIESSPRRVFDREARKALSKWKYQPKIVDGKPVRTIGLKTQMDFTLQ